MRYDDYASVHNRGEGVHKARRRKLRFPSMRAKFLRLAWWSRADIFHHAKHTRKRTSGALRRQFPAPFAHVPDGLAKNPSFAAEQLEYEK